MNLRKPDSSDLVKVNNADVERSAQVNQLENVGEHSGEVVGADNKLTPNRGEVFSGLAIFGIGLFLIIENTMISSSFALSIGGFNPPFGVVLLPLLIGIGMLVFNNRTVVAWGLIVFGIMAILLGILMGLQVHFRAVSLFYAIIMYGMTAGGIGLLLKGFLRGKKAR